ncbi:hypothetical protein OH76DRAFT_1486179 [Lentinus brumalis]|uniref:Uncharacterized protein n=1 Tax=Lentinus brumalis TaxID=2498619 RepID=A0A371CZJ8_9APHY|nr:hypothetical protein OH76DRAFT_1486179 [Polyporus brumalis]
MECNIAIEYLDLLEYAGPVGLSCDDTKLVPGLDPVYDKDRNGFVVLGGVGDPMPVADPEELNAAIAAGRIAKAEKLRLWVMNVPIPGGAPLILAAMGVSNKTSAEFLWELHQRILTGICDAGINVISSASDGATTERAVQARREETATHRLHYSIPHPAKATRLVFDIPCFGPQKQPLVMVQDARHALKTVRNNFYTGSRLLTLGPEVAHYSHARRMAHENGPLYMRDVEKVDRQDDNAAARLFSGDALEWFTAKHGDEHRGTAVYHFVYGEPVDSHIGCTMDIAERLKMAFRAEFFTDLWEIFLVRAGYSKSRHFVSHQAAAIIRRLTRSLVQLTYLFRDHLGGRYPLLPWLLSTEPCEHSFGTSRLIVEDFKMLQFYYMIPKITAHMRSNIFTSYHGDSKARANLAVLRQFPTDTEILSIVAGAYEEAVSLWAVLGVSPADLDPTLCSPEHGLPTPQAVLDDDDDASSDGESEFESDSDELEPAEQLLDDIIAELDSLSTDFITEDEILKLTYAAISLSVDERIQINSLSEPDEVDTEDWLAQTADIFAGILGHASDTSLPVAPLSDPHVAPESTLLDAYADMSELVKIRQQHQTLQAASGVRVRQGVEPAGASVPRPEGAAEIQEARHVVLRKLQNILKEHQSESNSPGLKRLARWTDGPARTAAGNSANAEQASKTRASKEVTRRRDIYKKFFPTDFDHLTQGRVSKLTPLTSSFDDDPTTNPDGFAFVLVDGRVRLGRVISVYSKGGGKHGRNGWVAVIESVSAASYIAIQVYDHTFGRQFCGSTSEAMARCRKKSYALIDPHLLLCKTRHPPKPVAGDLQVSPEDVQDFSRLKAVLPRLLAVVKELKKRKQSKNTAAEDADDEEEE